MRRQGVEVHLVDNLKLRQLANRLRGSSARSDG
jgi:hypothetical protein